MTYAEIMESAEKLLESLDVKTYLDNKEEPDWFYKKAKDKCLSALSEVFTDEIYQTYEWNDIVNFILEFTKLFFMGFRAGFRLSLNALYGEFKKEDEN